ncbi:MAG: HlyD family efflux transporter periplasmic adaptor subunit [Candidatus Aminicenantes bacterium]|jgi:HlyD family secretion protein
MSEEKDINQLLKEVEIRSEEVQEIMGFIPHWIIRWGLTAIFLVVIFLVIGSWFFKYPDIIASTIVVTTENPPANLVARSSGKITELYVQDKQKVREGEYIAIIENSTNHHHLFELKEKLDAMSSFFTGYALPVTEQFDKNYSLGELQSTYAAFLKSYADYKHFIELGYYQKKINSTKSEIARRQKLQKQLQRQDKIMEEELNLSREQYQRTIKLYNDNIISKSELESARSTYLQKEYTAKTAKTNLANSEIQINQLEQNVMELDLQFRENKTKFQSTLSQAYENLMGRIAQWEQSYLLKAPISGIVTFTKFWSINQNVTAGDKVITVVPEEGGKIIGKVVMPIRGSGKVKVGQRVNIKFANFPHMDYGIVTGIIKSISLVSSDNFYSLEVDLPDGLLTSYGKELEFSQEMQGTAEIITEDIRLLERIFKPIKAILKK